MGRFWSKNLRLNRRTILYAFLVLDRFFILIVTCVQFFQMPDCLASGHSDTGMKKRLMLESVQHQLGDSMSCAGMPRVPD
jgi:hypothetical protein